jgi:BlaI family transcriptional regulator, penicillinase repressor
MPRRPRTNRMLLTDIELELMRCVWDKGKASASEVQMQMIRSGRETAYTTVKTMLDRLVKAGVCKSNEIRGRYYYSPRVSQLDIAREWYEHLNRLIFGGRSKKSTFDQALQKLELKVK